MHLFPSKVLLIFDKAECICISLSLPTAVFQGPLSDTPLSLMHAGSFPCIAANILLHFRSAGQRMVNTALVLAAQSQLSEHLPWLHTTNLRFQKRNIRNITGIPHYLKLPVSLCYALHCSQTAFHFKISFLSLQNISGKRQQSYTFCRETRKNQNNNYPLIARTELKYA